MESNLQPAPDQSSSQAYIQMVRKMTSDMKFVGIFSIIYGAISCLAVISAITGIPMIIAGIRLKESADLFRNYIANNDFASLASALEKQGKYFFINKILIIIGLVAMLLSIFAVLIFLSAGGIHTLLNNSAM